MAIRIITDGACDLDTELLKLHDITSIPFYVSFDGVDYKKEKVEMDIREFYQKMVDHPDVFPRTSLPAIQDYTDIIEPMVQAGDEVICICFTSFLSGSYNSGCNAKMILDEEYPDAKITIVNSLCATVSQGSYVLEAARMRDAGMTYEEIIEKLEGMKADSKIFFTIENLDYLIHGGRIGKLAGKAGSVLKLKPLIVLNEGEVTSGGIARSRKKSILKVVSLMEEYFAEDRNINDYIINVGIGYDQEEGQVFYQKVKESAEKLGYTDEILSYQIGATIAVHTGPNALGIGVVPKFDR